LKRGRVRWRCSWGRERWSNKLDGLGVNGVECTHEDLRMSGERGVREDENVNG